VAPSPRSDAALGPRDARLSAPSPRSDAALGPRYARLSAPSALAARAAEPAGSAALSGRSLTPTLAAASAPGGALWAAQIAVPALQGKGWERVSSRSVHGQVARGCIGCHGGAALQPGALDHSFVADERVCASCHEDDALRAGRAAGAELRARALALAQALAPHCQVQALTPHAQAPMRCASSGLERARYELGVVLDDAAAIFHNPDLSRALLTDAAQQLSDHDAL
jgi:hypothetical protein